MVCYSHLFTNFTQFVVIHTVKVFGIVNRTKVEVSLELSCFSDDPVDVGNFISCFSAFSKSSLNIWKCMVHVLLKPGLGMLSITLLAREMSAIVFEHSLAFPFLGLELKLTFPSPVITAEFSIFAGILSAAFSQHRLLGFEKAQLVFHHLH